MDRSECTIVVTGATGKQGGSVARHLLADGWRVRAFVRDPLKPAAEALAEAGAEIALGDFDDADSVARALEGVYGAYSVQGWRPDGPAVEERRGVAFAEAAARAGVEHFVYSSVGGAERATGIPHFESKWHVEQRIRELGLPYTIWRPVYFMENLLWQRDGILGGHLRPPMDPDLSTQFIAVDDIGEFVALSFRTPGAWLGKATEIAGDERSFIEVAETLSRVLDRDIELEPVVRPDEPERVTMTEWMERRGYDADLQQLRRIYPDLTDFSTWAAETFGGGSADDRG